MYLLFERILEDSPTFRISFLNEKRFHSKIQSTDLLLFVRMSCERVLTRMRRTKKRMGLRGRGRGGEAASRTSRSGYQPNFLSVSFL